jgi:V8-like Glu-specific endopeptidase/rhodanese-related sulfurtransferase
LAQRIPADPTPPSARPASGRAASARPPRCRPAGWRAARLVAIALLALANAAALATAPAPARAAAAAPAPADLPATPAPGPPAPPEAATFIGPLRGAAPLGFRRFAGHRFVTVLPARVQREPAAASRILADIPRLRLVYAEPTADPSWLAVHGAGASPYPDVAAASPFVAQQNGRLVLPEIEDVGSYAPLIGFVPRDALVDLDPVAAEWPDGQAPEMPGLQPVPQLWEPLGLHDPRSFARAPAAPPFDAIARLRTRLGTCSAFFVSPQVLVSAGHCIPDRAPYDLSVLIERGRTQSETIEATLVQARRRVGFEAGLSEDWAVVQLRSRPRVAVTPLHFHHGEAFFGHAGLRVAAIGYPGDLTAVSQQLLGYQAPVVSACVAMLPESRADRMDEAGRAIAGGALARSGLRLHPPCITFPGDSGGPLLVWSGARGRFEVVGITSTYRERDPVTPVFSPATSSLVARFAEKLAVRYGVPPIVDEGAFRIALRQDTPGAALFSALVPTFGGATPWANFPLSTGLAEAIALATGDTPKLPIAAMLRADAPLRHPGGVPDGLLSADELSRARAQCARQCSAVQLDPANQVRATIGMRLETVAQFGLNGAALGGEAAERTTFHVVGGDLFAVDAVAGDIRAVARNVMNLVDAGADAAWDASAACRCAAATPPPQAAPPPDAPVVPDAQNSVSMIDPPALQALREHGGDVVVLAADAAPLLLPGALAVPDAASEKLAVLLANQTGGARDRPVAVYGRTAAAASGAALAARVVALGYRKVLLLREGLEGWAGTGLALARATEVAAAAH